MSTPLVSDYMVFDSDDFGCNHVISDQCQSHDCRDVLEELHAIQPNFKATLFTIPGEMTPELYRWAAAKGWVQLAWHGFYHESNYECAQMSYEEFDERMRSFSLNGFSYVRGFKAPGWQISDGVYQWLVERDWWIADQEYNDPRRPVGLKVYKVGENSLHTHTWDCVGNGVYELRDKLIEAVKTNDNWRFISEVI